MTTRSIDELASNLGTTPERLRTVVKQTLRQVPRSQYYVFRITSDKPASPTTRNQARTVAAFPSPDDALAFAQRNGYGSNAQLRPVSAADLVIRLLSDASIGTILFLETGAAVDGHGFGPGLKLTRTKLLAEFSAQETNPPGPTATTTTVEDQADQAVHPTGFQPSELTAERYDALQFGVNFMLRAEFRVALAQAVEEIVDHYQPPEGSVDSGPRSIYATTAVELWLRQHGFPHAFQRRWIDVADDPQWRGAVELCEIDCGTQRRLLVQLAIHQDENGRDFIKDVFVTS